ncbi:MAG: endonuclease/exonuclease/phosphatase family protein [Rhodospirillales bacterium]|jgi:endonuclease/exonuclease/phosphatase (EEP) superfamily protein YafD
MFSPLTNLAGRLRRADGRVVSDLARALERLRRRRPRGQGGAAELGDPGRGLRVLSWNVLRLTGASCAELAWLIERHQVDVALLQEATVEFEELPLRVGGGLVRHPLPDRIHGPAIWARAGVSDARCVPLFSLAIRRHAVVADVAGVDFASVHLSHGQLMCRRQAREAGGALAGSAAVIAGDFNMVGPLRLDGFREVGPRAPTHYANGLLPLRIDRCFVRGFACRSARALDPGGSDHRPILLDLAALPGTLARAAA